MVGEDKFEPIDVRVRVKGGGHTSQVYAIRQAIAKALVAYYAKYFDAQSAITLKKDLVAYDRSLLIADPRRMEPKKFGGGGARARRQKRLAWCDVSFLLRLTILFQLSLIARYSFPKYNCSLPSTLIRLRAVRTMLGIVDLLKYSTTIALREQSYQTIKERFKVTLVIVSFI